MRLRQAEGSSGTWIRSTEECLVSRPVRHVTEWCPSNGRAENGITVASGNTHSHFARTHPGPRTHRTTPEKRPATRPCPRSTVAKDKTSHVDKSKDEGMHMKSKTTVEKSPEGLMETRTIAKTMKVAEISGPGADFRIVDREIPRPDAGHVLIKVQACGVCHSDAFTKDGGWPGIQYPRVPGHEIAGIIDELGAGVSEWRKGQRVGVGWHGG